MFWRKAFDELVGEGLLIKKKNPVGRDLWSALTSAAATLRSSPPHHFLLTQRDRPRLHKLFMVLGFCLALCNVHAVDQPKIPADLLYKHKPLAAEQNAFADWLQVEEQLVPPSEEVSERVITEHFTGKQADPEHIALVDQWIQTNATVFQLLENSLKKDKAQAPRYDPDTLPLFLACSRKVTHARLFLAQQAATLGDQATATNLLLGNIKLAGMLRDADVPAIHYLVAKAIRTISEKAVVNWAYSSVQKTNASLIRGMLEQLPELDDEIPAYERMLRVEFTEAIAPSLDFANIQKRVEEARTNEWLMVIQPEELHRPYLLVHDPRLVSLHPKPYDYAATLNSVADDFRNYLRTVKSPWTDSVKDPFIDESESIKEQYLADLQPLLKATARNRLPLTQATAKRAAKYYVKVSNPVGRYQQVTPDALYRTAVGVFQSRTERSITRTLLALRLFELENGRPAKTLQELVDAKLLPSLPMDFFANAPLRYSSVKRILWSIGENGVDDGGVGKEYQWMEQDAVWTIPPIMRH